MEAAINRQATAIEEYARDKGLIVEPAKSFITLLSKSNNEDVNSEDLNCSFEGNRLEIQYSFKFLGIRFQARKDRIVFDEHYAYLKSQFLSARRLVSAMNNLDSGFKIAQCYRSIAYGKYNHGTDGLPIPEKKFLNPLQLIYNRTIVGFNKHLFPEICWSNKFVKYPPQWRILDAVGHPSLLTCHKISLLSRFSEILRLGVHDVLFDRIKRCLFFGDEEGNFLADFTDFLIDDRKRERLVRRALFFETGEPHWSFRSYEGQPTSDKLKAGIFQIWAKIPWESLGNVCKSRIKNSFPYCVVDLFNELPLRDRHLIGRKSFSGHIKFTLKNACQHTYNGQKTNSVCKRCKVGGRLYRGQVGRYIPIRERSCDSCREIVGRAKIDLIKVLRYSKTFDSAEMVFKIMVKNTKSHLNGLECNTVCPKYSGLPM